MANRGRPSTKNNYNDTYSDLENNVEENNGEIIDVEEIQDTEIIDDTNKSDNLNEETKNSFNPFNENVIQRDYSNPPIANNITEEIEEPSFKPPSYDDIMADRSNKEEISEQNPFINPNPVVNEMDSKDQIIACEMLVDTCLDAYEQFSSVAKWYAKIDEQDLIEKQMNGEIDLENQKVPLNENGSEISLGEFCINFNEQCDEALSYDKSFNDKVRPAMVRLFSKNGWGMSDGQFLAITFGKDLTMKGIMAYSLNKNIKGIMNMMVNQHQQNNEEKNNLSNDYENNDVELYESEDISYENEKKITEKKKRKQSKDKEIINYNIEYPQRPKDTISQHPKEVQQELRNSK